MSCKRFTGVITSRLGTRRCVRSLILNLDGESNHGRSDENF